MSKKKLTAEEREKIAEEIVNSDDNILERLMDGPKKKRDRSKNNLQKLINYNIIVESGIFWQSRQAYLNLLKDFSAKRIEAVDFRDKFFTLRIENMVKAEEICYQIEEGEKPILNLYYNSKVEDFSSAINELYLEIDRYDSNLENDDQDLNNIVYNERELRLVVEEKYLPILQKSCDLNDSFLRPQMDLDQLIRRSYLIFILSSFGFLINLVVPILS